MGSTVIVNKSLERLIHAFAGVKVAVHAHTKVGWAVVTSLRTLTDCVDVVAAGRTIFICTKGIVGVVNTAVWQGSLKVIVKIELEAVVLAFY